MRALAALAVFATLLSPTTAQQRQPIIDMHMHALAADAQGPPPLAMCTPFPEYPAWDPATPYGDLFVAKFKNPACADPIWSPTTDEEVMNQTVAIAERRSRRQKGESVSRRRTPSNSSPRAAKPIS